jgi:hypothetical protein
MRCPTSRDGSLELGTERGLQAEAEERSGKQIDMTKRISLSGVAFATLLLFPASGARAQNSHYLLARAGSSSQSESTFDVNDGHVEKLSQLGVGGVNPSYFSHFASADGDSGVMILSSSFSLLGGVSDPIKPSTDPRSVALIEQSIDPGTPTGDVTVSATLAFEGNVSLESGSGDVDGGSISALLDIDGCRVYFRRRFYSNGSTTDSPIDNCGWANATTVVGPGLLSVSITRSAASISGLTHFYVETQLDADATYLEYFDSGEWAASGVLSVEVTGAPYTFASPTFLTVPEPAAVGANLVALGALFAWRRRRCVRGVS